MFAEDELPRLRNGVLNLEDDKRVLVERLGYRTPAQARREALQEAA